MNKSAIINTGENTFSVNGVIDFKQAPALLSSGLKYFETTKDNVITVDLSNANVTNSAGVALLLVWLGKMRAEGKSIQYIGFSEKLLSLVKVSNLSSILGCKNEN